MLAERTAAVSNTVLTEATLAAVQRRDHAIARIRSDRLRRIADNPRERDEADEVGIFAARMAGDMDKALEVGFEAARRAGIVVPTRPSLLQVGIEVLRIRLADTRRAMQAGPLSDDELAVIAPRLRVLMATGSLLHESNMRQALIFGARSAEGRLGSGTALGASVCAFVCALTGGYVSAARWSEISDARQSPAQPNRAGSILTTTYFGHWFTRPRAELARRNDEAEALAYAEGDLSTAAYANRNRVLDSLFLDRSLAITAMVADQGLLRLDDRSTRPVIAATRQIAENLMSPGADRWRLQGDYFDASALRPDFGAAATQINNVYRPLAMLEAFLAVVCGAYAETAEIHDRLQWTFKDNGHNPQRAIWAFATGLALYRVGRSPPSAHLRLVRRLARLNPRDHRHRLLLLDAERARLKGSPAVALGLYEQAVGAAKASDCLLELGLVARAAAEAAAELGAPAAALGYQTEAAAAWRTVGAVALAPHPEGAAHSAPVGDGPVPAQTRPPNIEAEARELELAAARDAAERANRAKSRLLASVGHELRTPLQGIAGLVELAEFEAQPIDLDVLRGAVGQLTTVVGDLTDLGALDAGVLSLAQSEFDPGFQVAGVIAVHQPALNGTGRQICRIDEGPPTIVVGDPGRFRQIISNLIGNAIKHGRGDIQVRLTIEDSASDRVSVVTDVEDEGAGLPPADLARIFEPFERGPATDQITGLGLGLSIARRLAQAMDGALTAQAADREATVFRLRLELPRASGAPRAARIPGRALRVLLAEDTPLSRQVLAALLRAEGCEVDEAEDGEAALALATARDFDLLILDMHMPWRDGLAVAEAVREAPSRRAAVPIAIVTASATESVELRAVALGVEAVLQKPIGRSELRRVLVSAESGQWMATEPWRHGGASPGSRLSELRDSLGLAAAAEILSQVRPNAEAIIGRIEQAVEAEDLIVVAREAHRLAGLASHFGLSILSASAHALEAAVEQPSLAEGLSDLPARVAALEALLGAVDWTAFSEQST